MLGRLRRLFDKLQRLRLVDAQVAELHGRARSQQDQFAGLRGEFHDLRFQLAELHGCVRSQQDQLAGLRGEFHDLRFQCDLLKSKLEVPGALVAEFHQWRASHPPLPEPLVSICVATYNRAKLLTERCIPSVLGQTYGRLELIVVGDGCTDDTETSVARIRDPRLTFTNLPARGDYPLDRTRRWMVAGTHAGNWAISLARGDFITHLDDDDEYLPNRLETLVDFAVSHGCDFVWHPFWWEQEPGRWILNDAKDPVLGQLTTSSVFYSGWFRRLLWDMDAHLLGEPGDWNLFRRIKFFGPACGRCPEPLLRHYVERSHNG